MRLPARARAWLAALENGADLLQDPRGYAAACGFSATNTAAGLFRLLYLSIVADDSAPSPAAAAATRALFERRWDSAPEMAKTDEQQRADVLSGAGQPGSERAARQLGQATKIVLERYDGDLQQLRSQADGDGERIRELLSELPGMDESGVAVFVRDAQMFWPEVAPFADGHARRAAERLGLPSDPGELMQDVARGSRHEQLAWITGALALIEPRRRVRDDRTSDRLRMTRSREPEPRVGALMWFPGDRAGNATA